MTIQQWLFPFKRHIGRRDFWIWTGLWIVGMLVLFSLANEQLLDIQTTVFCLVRLLWPTVAMAAGRLNDRGHSGVWALLVVPAWMLLAGSWAMLPGVWQWAVGRFVPTLILIGMLIDLDALIGTQDTSKYDRDAQDIKYRADSQAG